MKLDLSQKIVDADSVVIRRRTALPDGSVKDEGDLLLTHVLFASVNSTFKGEEQLSPEELYKRGRLARKVKDKGEKNFSSEEIQLMLACVAKRYVMDPVFVLSVSEILDPEKFKAEGSKE